MTQQEFFELRIGQHIQIIAAGKDKGRVCRIVGITNITAQTEHEIPCSCDSPYTRKWTYTYELIGRRLVLEPVNPDEVFAAQGFEGSRTRIIKSKTAIVVIDNQEEERKHDIPDA